MGINAGERRRKVVRKAGKERKEREEKRKNMKTNKQYIYIVRRLRKRWWRGRREKACFTKGRQLTEEEEEGGMKGEQPAGVGTPKLEYVEKGIKWGEEKGGEGG